MIDYFMSYRRVSFDTFRSFLNVYLGFFFSALVYCRRGAMSYVVVRALSSYVLSFVSLSAVVSKRSRLS
jgi:rhodanese-related sulfurtransferase